jgi:hypothetical protein
VNAVKNATSCFRPTQNDKENIAAQVNQRGNKDNGTDMFQE